MSHLTRRQAAAFAARSFDGPARCFAAIVTRASTQRGVSPVSRHEIPIILHGMWDNIGRTFGEYGHVPELMSFSADTPTAGQVVMDERTATLVRDVGSQRRGALMFAAHLGNWEIPAMTARVGGRKIALAYKPQPSRAMTNHLIARAFVVCRPSDRSGTCRAARDAESPS